MLVELNNGVQRQTATGWVRAALLYLPASLAATASVGTDGAIFEARILS